MNAWRRQAWLVAVREMRERGRSRAFQVSVVVMLVVVVGMIMLPAMLDDRRGASDVGLVGAISVELPDSLRTIGESDEIDVRVREYDDQAVGEAAVRSGDVDVLVVDGQRLEWRRQADEPLKAVVSEAIQLVAVRERAAAAGIGPDALVALIAPVPIENVELGSTAGRSPNDETAALLMSVLLLVAITTYGNLVLTGVVEEKTSRVVEVLLARMPARSLLAGKVAGIGLLGLAQFTVTAGAALLAAATVDSVDVPAARGAVVAWVVVWFVLGYAFYAMLYGALGSLASRTEDASSVTGPVTVVLVAAYFASFAAVGRPDSGLAQLTSFLPPTAPLAMPARVAMGAVAWWEPFVALAATVAAITALLRFAGRVYAGAVLHAGPTVKVRDAWRSAATATATAPRRPPPTDGAVGGSAA